MGYTHYWWRKTRALDGALFLAALEDVRKILAEIERVGIALGDGYGDGRPTLTPDVICFNGARPKSCETFLFPIVDFDARESSSGLGIFGFTKTYQLPYDLAVTAALVVLKMHFGEQLTVSTDGSTGDWTAALLLVERVLGRKPNFEIRREREGVGKELLPVAA